MGRWSLKCRISDGEFLKPGRLRLSGCEWAALEADGMRKERDFASVLDQLMAEAAAARDDSAPSPAIQLDPLSVAEELCSGGIVFSTEELTARYADEMHNPDDNQTDPAKPRVNAPPLDPGMEALNTDRQSIARELGLDGRQYFGARCVSTAS